jgi:hypothetical protein
MNQSQTAMQTPMIPAAWGEVIDKITILEIKNERITAPAALINVGKELALLAQAVTVVMAQPKIRQLKDDLKAVNQALWDIEDRLRDKERAQDFGAEFVELARSVYRLNDQRATLKKHINTELASEIVEEKSYRPY